jgi:hypothetical protein
MRGDLNMSTSAFGFAAGMFFSGYFIFEVPGNKVLERVGSGLAPLETTCSRGDAHSCGLLRGRNRHQACYKLVVHPARFCLPLEPMHATDCCDHVHPC